MSDIYLNYFLSQFCLFLSLFSVVVCQLFQLMWQHETVPQDFKDASIIHLYKRKGNRQVCDNHRGISLLSIAGKILARVLLNRLNAHPEQGLLPESQRGFWKERGTIDMVCATRQLQEKCQEQHTDLHSTYADLTKAFDTVSRHIVNPDMVWKPGELQSVYNELSFYVELASPCTNLLKFCLFQ